MNILLKITTQTANKYTVTKHILSKGYSSQNISWRLNWPNPTRLLNLHAHTPQNICLPEKPKMN